MKYFLYFFFIICCSSPSLAQFSEGFPSRSISPAELDMMSYPQDSSANAVVLNEFGLAYIDEENENRLRVEYYIKIKVLSKQGAEKANFIIPLRKGDTGSEEIVLLEATTYNKSNNKIREASVYGNQIFTTSVNQYNNETKFTLPDVQPGSVLEVRYIFESPFIFNFYPWKFQSDMPKLKSEFWARIPGNYVYNMSLRGFLDLSKNESSIIPECYTPGPYKADCAMFKYAMIDIPAFKEEEYMTAKRNFMSTINYELSEVKYFDGRVVKYTKTWKDVDKELMLHDDFGVQIKKGKNVWEKVVPTIVGNEQNPLRKAALIYDYIKNWFVWNEFYGKYAETGLKKAFESRKGNVGDINLSLIAALQESGLKANPVILATREAGLPNELYPIISEFNYVVACLELEGKKIFLDATEPLLPLGVLPERCLNGKGRLIGIKDVESGWVDISPSEKQKQQISLNLKLDGQKFIGEMFVRSFGYEAFEKRKAIKSEGSFENYRESLNEGASDFTILKGEIENLDDLNQPLVEKFLVETSLDISDPNTLYLNPFFGKRWKKNPFVSNQRLYPVDFGAPLETTFLLNLEYPQTYEIDDMPKSAALVLPQNGGKFLFSVTNASNKLSMTSIINLNKVVYSSAEYHNIKELFNRIIDIHQSLIVFKKR